MKPADNEKEEICHFAVAEPAAATTMFCGREGVVLSMEVLDEVTLPESTGYIGCVQFNFQVQVMGSNQLRVALMWHPPGEDLVMNGQVPDGWD